MSLASSLFPAIQAGVGFGTLCALQTAFTVLVCMDACREGVKRLDPDQAGRRRRRRLRRGPQSIQEPTQDGRKEGD
jgi:hypothetical protein